MISIDIDITCDPLKLLKGEIPDIEKEVKRVITEVTDYYNDKIIEELFEKYDDFMEMYEKSSLSFSDYIIPKTNEVFFIGDTNTHSLCLLIYTVPCDFDEERYLTDLLKEYEKTELDIDVI